MAQNLFAVPKKRPTDRFTIGIDALDQPPPQPEESPFAQGLNVQTEIPPTPPVTYDAPMVELPEPKFKKRPGILAGLATMGKMMIPGYALGQALYENEQEKRLAAKNAQTLTNWKREQDVEEKLAEDAFAQSLKDNAEMAGFNRKVQHLMRAGGMSQAEATSYVLGIKPPSMQDGTPYRIKTPDGRMMLGRWTTGGMMDETGRTRINPADIGEVYRVGSESETPPKPVATILQHTHTGTPIGVTRTATGQQIIDRNMMNDQERQMFDAYRQAYDTAAKEEEAKASRQHSAALERQTRQFKQQMDMLGLRNEAKTYSAAVNELLEGESRLKQVQDSLQAIKEGKPPGPHDMNLLSQHIFFTFGGVKGARVGRDLIEAHLKARSLPENIAVAANKVMQGDQLSPQQRQEFSRLVQERLEGLKLKVQRLRDLYGPLLGQQPGLMPNPLTSDPNVLRVAPNAGRIVP